MTDFSENKILAFGASGRFGALVVPALARHGACVRAFLRNPTEADRVREAGARETTFGDLRDDASLKAALSGIDGVFYLGPAFAEDEATLGTRAVAAAVEAGVRRFVFSSLLQPGAPLAHHAAKLPVEAALRDSGLAYTILQPAVFYQNLIALWPTTVETSCLALPYAREVAFVDYRDVAEAAAIALSGDRLANGTFELCGEARLDRRAIAAAMSEATGRGIAVAEQSPDDWARTTTLSMSDRERGLRHAMFAHYDTHGLAGNTLALSAILGREPRRMSAFLQELAGTTPEPTP